MLWPWRACTTATLLPALTFSYESFHQLPQPAASSHSTPLRDDVVIRAVHEAFHPAPFCVPCEALVPALGSSGTGRGGVGGARRELLVVDLAAVVVVHLGHGLVELHGRQACAQPTHAAVEFIAVKRTAAVLPVAVAVRRDGDYASTVIMIDSAGVRRRHAVSVSLYLVSSLRRRRDTEGSLALSIKSKTCRNSSSVLYVTMLLLGATARARHEAYRSQCHTTTSCARGRHTDHSVHTRNDSVSWHCSHGMEQPTVRHAKREHVLHAEVGANVGACGAHTHNDIVIKTRHSHAARGQGRGTVRRGSWWSAMALWEGALSSPLLRVPKYQRRQACALER